MSKTFLAAIAAVTTLTATSALAETATSTRPDAHGPLGVMGEHVHKAGEWMLSYRYSTMRMKGNRDTTNSLSTADVLADYMVSPKDMDMQMHMFGGMRGITDDLTLMVGVPYIQLEMDHVTRMGAEFETKAEGFGDVKATGLYRFYKDGSNQLLANVGVSIPTGNIDERDDTPAMNNAKLPYPMQLGSGTFDPIVGLTYTGKQDDWSWGAQGLATFRLYENSNDYRKGNEYNLTGWGAYKLNEYVSLSGRLEGKWWMDYKGRDPQLNPMMVPTADVELRGGRRVDAYAGINLIIPEWNENRFAIEFGAPIYQHLDGPQLETDYRLIAGWQYAF